MQSSLPAEPGDRNTKAADAADFAEVAKIVEVATARSAHDQAAMARPSAILVADWKPVACEKSHEKSHPSIVRNCESSHWICRKRAVRAQFLVISHEKCGARRCLTAPKLVSWRFRRQRRGSSLPGGASLEGRESVRRRQSPLERLLPCSTALHRARHSPSLPSGLRASGHRPAEPAVGFEP
jgi:hypothetical protein